MEVYYRLVVVSRSCISELAATEILVDDGRQGEITVA